MTSVLECGKVINSLKFQMKNSDMTKQVVVCALNTHMSMAAKKAEYAKKASTIATEKGCDITVFVGDFNSRLHCLNDLECLEACTDEEIRTENPCSCSPIFDVNKTPAAPTPSATSTFLNMRPRSAQTSTAS